jgi:hypothetical protein
MCHALIHKYFYECRYFMRADISPEKKQTAAIRCETIVYFNHETRHLAQTDELSGNTGSIRTADYTAVSYVTHHRRAPAIFTDVSGNFAITVPREAPRTLHGYNLFVKSKFENSGSESIEQYNSTERKVNRGRRRKDERMQQNIVKLP